MFKLIEVWKLGEDTFPVNTVTGSVVVLKGLNGSTDHTTLLYMLLECSRLKIFPSESILYGIIISITKFALSECITH